MNSKEERLSILEKSHQTLLRFEKSFLKENDSDVLLSRYAQEMRTKHQHYGWDNLVNFAKKNLHEPAIDGTLLTLESIEHERTILQEKITERKKRLNPSDKQNLIPYWKQAREELKTAIKQFLNCLSMLHNMNHRETTTINHLITVLTKTMPNIPLMISKTTIQEFRQLCLNRLNPQKLEYNDSEENSQKIQTMLEETKNILNVLVSSGEPQFPSSKIIKTLSEEIKIAYDLITRLDDINQIKEHSILKKTVTQQDQIIMVQLKENTIFSNLYNQYEKMLSLFNGQITSHYNDDTAYQEFSNRVNSSNAIDKTYHIKRNIFLHDQALTSGLSTFLEYQNTILKPLDENIQKTTLLFELIKIQYETLCSRYQNSKRSLITTLHEKIQSTTAFIQFRNAVCGIGLIMLDDIDEKTPYHTLPESIQRQNHIISNGQGLFYADAKERHLIALSKRKDSQGYEQLQNLCTTQYKPAPESLFESIRKLTNWDQLTSAEKTSVAREKKEHFYSIENITLCELKNKINQEIEALDEIIIFEKINIEAQLKKAFIEPIALLLNSTQDICSKEHLSQLHPLHPAKALLIEIYPGCQKTYQDLLNHLNQFKNIPAQDIKDWNDQFTFLSHETHKNLRFIQPIAQNIKEIQRRLDSGLWRIFEKAESDLHQICEQQKRLNKKNNKLLKTLQVIQRKFDQFREDYIPTSGFLNYHQKTTMTDAAYCENFINIIRSELQHERIESLSDGDRFRLVQFIRIHILKPLQQFFNKIAQKMKNTGQFSLINVTEKPTLSQIKQMIQMTGNKNNFLIHYKNDLFCFDKQDETLRKIEINPQIKTQYTLTQMTPQAFVQRKPSKVPQFILVGQNLYFCPANKPEETIISTAAVDVYSLLNGKDHRQRLSIHDIQKIQAITRKTFEIDCPEINNMNQLKKHLSQLNPAETTEAEPEIKTCIDAVLKKQKPSRLQTIGASKTETALVRLGIETLNALTIEETSIENNYFKGL